MCVVKSIDRYIHAATRENTRRSYQSAVEHFEATWGGFLPATADSVARYLAAYANSLAFNTLKQRLSALAQWHIDQGFADPTKAPVVKKVLKGIKELHPALEKRATPLQLEQIQHLVLWLDEHNQRAVSSGNRADQLVDTRDKALVLLGFWRGFRSDELTRLRVEHIQIVPGEGMTLFLPRSKADRSNQGQWFKAPALSRLCPVSAYQEWITLANLTDGPVFRRIDRWGCVGEDPLNPGSVIPLLRRLFHKAGIPQADSYSGHSLRRGFANWANANQWDVKTLMEYVGWKDIKSAMRYIDAADPFARRRIENALESVTPAPVTLTTDVKTKRNPS